ncbi:MAG: lamin tail domain-containing protein [Anaerolineae bacterium]|nr:lamin tail domain-containing protein [Anaerolineae bacterium]
MRTGRCSVLLMTVAIPLLVLWQLEIAAVAGSEHDGVAQQTPTRRDLSVEDAARMASSASAILIDAVLFDGYALYDRDEAVRLVNEGSDVVDLSGWHLTDGTSTAILPPGTSIAPGDTLWMAGNAAAFTFQFGFSPDVVPATWPGFANLSSGGDEVILKQPDGTIVDGLVYGAGDTTPSWWQGSALQPYTVRSLFAAEGQILYRRRDPLSGARVPDTDREADWAQTRSDVIEGRKVQFPGWSFDEFHLPLQVTETAVLTVGVAPDNALAVWFQAIERAGEEILVESFTFENIALATALASAASRGVSVSLLLEGDPVGGVTDQERWACQRVEQSAGACWFMVRDDDARIHDRYRYLHAKFMIVDGRELIVSSENLSLDSLPDDDKSDGTWGRRGLVLATNAPTLVARALAIFDDDLAPASHADLRRWHSDDPVYGPPPPGFVPVTVTGGISYTVRFPTPAIFSGMFPLELIQAPESSLHYNAGVIGLLARAGQGDEILAQQLSERAHWGSSSDTADSDPNPRLEAMIAAARRGARVRLLLDSFFNTADNTTTCDYVNTVARDEQLNLVCALANPTGLGLHNKMILVRAGGVGWVHAGSLNGTEQAHKNSRELALQVQSDELHAYLRHLFTVDWPHRLYLPLLGNRTIGPPPHPLISEVVYDPPGTDAAEYIELVNPLGHPFDISHWSIGDAVLETDFEDVRRFPDGTRIGPSATLVIAFSAADFQARYGRLPDFEVYDSTPHVPDLPDDPAGGDPAAILQLGNEGDEIILRDAQGRVVDVVAYGSGAHPQVVSCPLLATSGHSLERYPYWRDTDDCPADFRDWPLPNPGELSP